MRPGRRAPFKTAAVLITATLAAFATVTAVIWFVVLWLMSLLPEIGNGG